MKKLILLTAILSFLFSAGARAQADSLVMWTNNEVQFHSMPAIHPNGNVLIRSHYDILEIDGLTGEIIRNINVPFTGYVSDWIDISKDGTRFVACRKIVNFETGEIIGELPEETAYVKFFHPDNNLLIYKINTLENNRWFIMNIDQGNSIIVENLSNYTTAFEVSLDGRFLALATLENYDTEDESTHFYLFDAQTMQFIKELEDYPANGRRIEYIQFSENAKYVGYGHKNGHKKATYFTCEAPYQKWEYGFYNIGFINEEYIFLFSSSVNYCYGVIRRISDNTDIYETNIYSSRIPLFNDNYNSIITDYFFLSDPEQFIRCLNSLDFEKILSTVGVKDELDTNAFRAEYSGGILTINGLESQSVEINLTINNIQGEVVFSQNIAAVHGSQISLSVSLPSGVYIARIRTGENNYSSKFIVVN